MNTCMSAVRRLICVSVLGWTCSALAQTSPPPAVNTDPNAAARIVLPEPANPQLPSVFFIGDSTVRNGRDDGQNKGAEGQWGWGNPIKAYFQTDKINVVNRAIGGLSSRTYLTGGHWQRSLALMKPGDFVIMQFGHNDNGPLNDTSRARGTIKGIGEEAEEIDNLLTKLPETVHSYGWYLRKFIAEARAKGVQAIVCSPIPRKGWDASGKINRSKASYGGWAEQLAKREKADFIDLNENIATAYDAMGKDEVLKLFPMVTPDEHTHTNLAGAEFNARVVVAGIKTLQYAQLKNYLNDKSVDLKLPAASPK
ncbi:MAG: rhamnogalacturonan acetylesterase [Burkholderiales bacterium]|nr:rhamnogalacturonan acetylesterase [Burkholderiales bacterium]